MAIRITPRDGAIPTCPYCFDQVPVGRECPRCATRYHDECAATFGRCATLGCKAPLDAGPQPSGRALPRLAAIAARLAGGVAPAAWLDDDDGQSFVALLPSSGALTGAAEAVAELLGQTTYDGRLRTASLLPEPLVRMTTREDAERARERLASYGLRAVAIPARRFLVPLERIDAVRIDLATERVVDATGAERSLPSPRERLVITAQAHEVSTVVDERRGGRASTSRLRKARREPLALVFAGGAPTPLLLRRDAVRVEGTRDPTAYGRWASVVAALTAGAAHTDLVAASANPALLAIRRPVGSWPPEEDNLAGLLLAARLLHVGWRGA